MESAINMQYVIFNSGHHYKIERDILCSLKACNAVGLKIKKNVLSGVLYVRGIKGGKC